MFLLGKIAAITHTEPSSSGPGPLGSSLNSPSSGHSSSSSFHDHHDDIIPRAPLGDTDSMEHGFTPRERHGSNTTISAASSYQSIASSITSVDLISKRASQGGLSTVSTFSRDDEPEGRAKTIFSRGEKMLRRHKPKSSLPTRGPIRLDEEFNQERARQNGGPSYASSHGYRSPTNSAMIEVGRRRNISLPYNFHHMTHAQAKQFSEIEWTNREEIMTESTAIRVSRTPCRELQGIQAEDLHFKNSSSEALARPLQSSKSVVTSPVSTGNGHKRRGNHERRISQTMTSPRTLRHMRSLESFSQPNPPKSPKVGRSGASPVTPPQRRSSKAARTSKPDSTASSTASPSTPALEKPFAAGGFCTPGALKLETPSPRIISGGSGTNTESSDLPHAVTTPDDTAKHLSPVLFAASAVELDCVPEEEEGQPSKRTTRRSSRSLSGPRSKRSPSDTKTSSVRHSSNGSLRSISEIQHHRFSSTKLSVSDRANKRHSTAAVRRESWGTRLADRCWEDDIDFCYEHAAEADCDFDWDRISYGSEVLAAGLQADPFTNAPRVREERRVELEREFVGQYSENHNYPTKALQPSVLFPACLGVPDSKSRAAHPAPINNEHTITPRLRHASTISHETSFNEAEGFTLSPALLIPTDYEPIYGGIIDEKAAAPYTLYESSIEPPESGRESFRSSRTTLSKCCSHESIALRHKASDSGGSLPELVHSRNYREEFNHVAEQLAEQIASLNTTDIPPEPPLNKLRRNRSLVKDVAHQAMLRRAASSNALNEATITYRGPTTKRPLLSRASSDDPLKIPSTEASSTYDDQRRAESAANIASLRARNRALYSLFPTTPPASPRSPVSPI